MLNDSRLLSTIMRKISIVQKDEKGIRSFKQVNNDLDCILLNRAIVTQTHKNTPIKSFIKILSIAE